MCFSQYSLSWNKLPIQQNSLWESCSEENLWPKDFRRDDERTKIITWIEFMTSTSKYPQPQNNKNRKPLFPPGKCIAPPSTHFMLQNTEFFLRILSVRSLYSFCQSRVLRILLLSTSQFSPLLRKLQGYLLVQITIVSLPVGYSCILSPLDGLPHCSQNDIFTIGTNHVTFKFKAFLSSWDKD